MKHNITIFSLLLLSSHNLWTGIVNTPIAEPNKDTSLDPVNRPDFKWITTSYVGYAWSGWAGITNPNPAQFNQAAPPDFEDGKLGNVPFAGFSIGRRMSQLCILNFSYDVYGAFGYRRVHQNAILPTQQAGVEILGTKYVRSFILDHQAALFNLYLDLPNSLGVTIKRMHIKPIAGAGVGVGINKVRGFQTVGYNASAPYAQTTTLCNANTHMGFAWKFSIGLILKPEHSAVSFGAGYRYCNGGKFMSGTQYVLNDNYNQGAVVQLDPWTGTLKTQEFRMYINAEF